MKITIFGATGALGSECLKQALEDGHEVTALIRSPSKLPDKLKEKITLIEGDGLNPDDVKLSLSNGTEAILFAIGVDKNSPRESLYRYYQTHPRENAEHKYSTIYLVWRRQHLRQRRPNYHWCKDRKKIC